VAAKPVAVVAPKKVALPAFSGRRVLSVNHAVRIIQRDEAQYCCTLLGHIEVLGKLPSRGGSDL
jgi:hypothetical protein